MIILNKNELRNYVKTALAASNPVNLIPRNEQVTLMNIVRTRPTDLSRKQSAKEH